MQPRRSWRVTNCAPRARTRRRYMQALLFRTARRLLWPHAVSSPSRSQPSAPIRLPRAMLRGRPPLPQRKEKRSASRLFLPLVALIGLFGFASLLVHNPNSSVLPTNAFRRVIAPRAAEAAVEAEAAGEPPAVPEAPRLLSRRTELWDTILAEGLYHENSGYPEVKPPGEKEENDWRQWQEKVTAEYPNGAPLAGLRFAAHAPHRLQAGHGRERDQAPVLAPPDHHRPGARRGVRPAGRRGERGHSLTRPLSLSRSSRLAPPLCSTCLRSTRRF